MPRPVLIPFLLVAAGSLAGAEPKDHVLFMGTDLAVQKGEAFLRVQDVSGSSFMVKMGDDPVYVPMQMRAANVKVEKKLKLTVGGVRIGKLRGDRTYSPANDPRLKFDRQSGAASGAKAASDVAGYQADIFRQAAETARSNNDENRANALEVEQQRFEGLDRMATEALASDMGSPGQLAGRLQGEMQDGNFDAMEVEFEVSSEQPITDAYIIIISRFREKGTKAGVSRNWIYAKSIGEIGPKPRYIRIREGGFPFGFILEDYELHVYDGGRELATNVSPKRVELTREEAQQYLMIEHLAAHKQGTAPAEPAVGRLPPDLRERITEGHYLQPYYVRVDENGNAAGVFLDAACRKPVTDPYLTDLFAAVLFKPALVGGKPTTAVCRVKLPELRL